MTKLVSSQAESREEALLHLGNALQEFLRGIETARERAAKQQHLHPTDFRCLGYLHSVGRPVSTGQVIAHLGITSGSGTALFDRLAAAGYIRRIPNPEDRRSVLIELDSERAAAPIEQYQRIAQSYRSATERFDDRQLALITHFLERLAGVTDCIA